MQVKLNTHFFPKFVRGRAAIPSGVDFRLGFATLSSGEIATKVRATLKHLSVKEVNRWPGRG
jgi:hypothetical protein